MLDNRLVSLTGISKQVVLQNTSSSFSLKTTLLWLRLLICWQSGSSRWVCSRPQETLLWNNSFTLTVTRSMSPLICHFFISTAGVEPAQVQERVENHLKSLLIKHFDPQKADSIFTVEGEVRFRNNMFILQMQMITNSEHLVFSFLVLLGLVVQVTCKKKKKKKFLGTKTNPFSCVFRLLLGWSR